MHTIADMHRQILGEGVLELHDGLVEKIASAGCICVDLVTLPVLVINIDQCGMVDLFRDHRRQKV